MKTGSAIEDQFLNQIRAARLPLPNCQEMFHAEREWKLDFAWPTWMVAVEVHGATYTRGRHTRGKGMREDRVKIAEAILAGWSVFEFTSDQVIDGEAIGFVRRFFNQL